MSRPVKFSDPEEFSRIAHGYMDKADADKEFVPTVNGLAVELGLHRDSLVEYGKKPEFSDPVKSVRARLEAWWEQRLAGGNAAGTIFWLKNQGWTDKTQQELSGPSGGPIQTQRVEFAIIDPANPDS